MSLSLRQQLIKILKDESMSRFQRFVQRNKNKKDFLPKPYEYYLLTYASFDVIDSQIKNKQFNFNAMVDDQTLLFYINDMELMTKYFGICYQSLSEEHIKHLNKNNENFLFMLEGFTELKFVRSFMSDELFQQLITQRNKYDHTAIYYIANNELDNSYDDEESDIDESSSDTDIPLSDDDLERAVDKNKEKF